MLFSEKQIQIRECPCPDKCCMLVLRKMNFYNLKKFHMRGKFRDFSVVSDLRLLTAGIVCFYIKEKTSENLKFCLFLRIIFINLIRDLSKEAPPEGVEPPTS